MAKRLKAKTYISQVMYYAIVCKQDGHVVRVVYDDMAPWVEAHERLRRAATTLKPGESLWCYGNGELMGEYDYENDCFI